jgi:hypothetical protein
VTAPHFEVDRVGLRKLLARRGIEFAALELLQNALDEKSTCVHVKLEPHATRGSYVLTVADDNPDGFADLRHAYTLFAESAKKGNPEQRGRFNLGEKLVIAAATHAEIVTTTGHIVFDEDGRRSQRSRTESGSVVTARLRMTKDDVERTERALRTVLVPPDVVVTLNGGRLPSRIMQASFEARLATEIADDDGYLRPTERLTRVNLYPVEGGETPTLYEMGIPVVTLDGAWHVDVCQKVPLNTDRDNVTPAYARRIRALVVNEMHGQLGEHAKAAWVDDAIESKLVSDEAVTAVLTERYGERRVIRDLNDPEGTKLAMSKGYSIIEPGSFSGPAWESIRRAGAALPAGKVTPSPKVVFSAGGEDVSVDPSTWSAGMRRVVDFTDALGPKLLNGVRIRVDIVNDPRGYAACFGDGTLLFNLRRLGRVWFEKGPLDEEVLQLIIHEVGHFYVSDHLSEGYHDALCKLGARLSRLALDEPAFFSRWRWAS